MILREINAEYERIRHEELQALREREAQCYAMHPDFLELKARRDAAMDALSGQISSGAKAAAETARTALLAISKDEQALLMELGLPTDYLTLHVRCKLCHDTGYVGEGRRTRCTCMEKAIFNRERSTSRLNEDETFSCFNPAVYPNEAQAKQMQSAKKYFESYANAFPDTALNSLVLMGAPGLGKSFFLNCIAYRVLERGYMVRKITAYNLQQSILGGIRAGTDGEAQFLSVPLLLIDDLGTEPILNNITREYLFSILNERYNDKKHTVVATNLTQTQLQERYGERIFTRLINNDGGILKFSGENLRLTRGAKA